MVTERYCIGTTVLEIARPAEMKYPENLKKFRIAESENDEQIYKDAPGETAGYSRRIRYQLQFSDNLDKLKKQFLSERTGIVCERENLTVFQRKGGECRFLRLCEGKEEYAISAQMGENRYFIWFKNTIQIQRMLELDTVFLSPFALEKQMIQENGLILHCAYINWKGNAILFSADSGVGKSTQADLWEKYRHAEIINGDRALIRKKEKGWYAEGWPVCGSSMICKKETFPVRQIVMLQQAKINRVTELKGMMAVKKVLPQITVNRWNREFQNYVMNQVELLLSEVPVCQLECDISEQAVACLEEYLTGN